MSQKRISYFSYTALTLILGGLLLNLQRITPAPHLDDLSSGSMLDSLYAIALAALVLFLAAGLGSLLIKPFKLDGWSFVERSVIGIPLGLAAMAYGVFFMGLAGFIKPLHLILWLIVIAVFSSRESIVFLEEAIGEEKNFRQTWSKIFVHPEGDLLGSGAGAVAGAFPGFHATLGL